MDAGKRRRVDIKNCHMRVRLLSNETEIAWDQATATKLLWCAVGLSGL